MVAPRLLGAVLRHHEVALRITEVEAYSGEDDPASHASRGRTQRNSTMFAAAGHLYCYFTYGMHVCANVVVGGEGSAGAVLVRAGEVVDGLDVARERRSNCPDRDLARGPARLCRALGITLAHDGSPLGPASEVALAFGHPPARWMSGPRVGVRLAADRPWRFWVEGDPTVSPYRRHPRAPR